MSIKNKNIVGGKFGEFNQITVIEEVKEGHKYKVIVQCEICSKDPELFGDGVFKTLKNSINRGVLPCGCAKTVKYSKEQNEIRITRECKKRGYEFIGWIDGEYSGSIRTTRVQLLCNKHGNIWNCRASEILQKKNGGCPQCGIEATIKKITKPDEEMISDFIATGKFMEGTKFWRSERKNNYGQRVYWKYYCPKCSNDEFVTAGVCSGTFESFVGNLKAGQPSCRCQKSIKYTKEQKQYLIEKRIREENLPLTFVKFVNDHRFLFHCNNHDLNTEMSVKNFITVHQGCAACAKHGFDRSKDACVYVLKIISNNGESFVGYGITTDPHTRLMTHNSVLKKHGFYIESNKIYNNISGSEAQRIEAAIKQNFELTPKCINGFRRESTHYHEYDNVVKFVKDHIVSLEQE